jgi:hypothetical protein
VKLSREAFGPNNPEAPWSGGFFWGHGNHGKTIGKPWENGEFARKKKGFLMDDV